MGAKLKDAKGVVKTNPLEEKSEKNTKKKFSYRAEDISVNIRLAAIFSVLFLGSIACFLTVKYYQGMQKSIERIIDVSGRNRMLSQRIAFLCERDVTGDPKLISETKSLIAQVDKALEVLKFGGETENGYLSPANTNDELKEIAETVSGKWIEYRINANTILTAAVDKPLASIDTNEINNVNYPASNKVSPEVLAALNQIRTLSWPMMQSFDSLTNAYIVNHEKQEATFNYFLVGLLIFFFILTIFLITQTDKYLVKPLREIGKVSDDIAKGNISMKVDYIGTDQYGVIATSINNLIDNLQNVKYFAQEVGKGKFESDIHVFNNEGELGTSLKGMRESLMHIAEEDRKRNWVTAGLAKFADILRSNNESIEKVSENILSVLIKYVGANQGAIFMLNDDKKNHPILQMVACYAWDKKKFIEKEILPGEGLTGRAWQEGETIYLTDVPDDYVSITSGLGKANPKCVIIVPLKVNDEINGILEMASFKVFEPHEMDFVEKLGMNIASTMSGVRVNARTKVLLHESQQQSEMLKAQEEEMRQNMEEMQATQEEMQRKEDEMKKMVTDLREGEERSRSQEEELRQNLEEMMATQEEMQRKEAEMKKLVSDVKQNKEHSRSHEGIPGQNVEERAMVAY